MDAIRPWYNKLTNMHKETPEEWKVLSEWIEMEISMGDDGVALRMIDSLLVNNQGDTLYTETAFGDVYESHEKRLTKKHLLSEDLVEELLIQRARGWADKSDWKRAERSIELWEAQASKREAKAQGRKSRKNSGKMAYMNSQREREKERLEKHQRENKKTPIPDLGGENVPMDVNLTQEGN